MNKTLVAYFSAGGTTAKLAKNLAVAINADLFEIQPQAPYTKTDLDWTNPTSRSSQEMNDAAARPAIVQKVNHMEQYEYIFLGFPIWWYVAPKIILTFLESYDLHEKKIIPFATSGGSGMDKIQTYLQACCHGAVLFPGRRFPSSADADTLASWAQQF